MKPHVFVTAIGFVCLILVMCGMTILGMKYEDECKENGGVYTRSGCIAKECLK